MPVSCSICTDFLGERPSSLNANEELKICAISCGHILHEVCIREWFTNSGNGDSGECPLCKTSCSLSNALRVYPTYDDDDSVDGRSERGRQKPREIPDLDMESELNVTLRELVDTKEKLRVASEANEILKVEYSESLAKIEALEEKVQLTETQANIAKSEAASLLADTIAQFRL